MVKRALLIAINYYNTGSELNGCINDIMSMQKFLESASYTEITMLYDHREDPHQRLSNAPTYKNILGALTKFIGSSEAGDSLYVHYSGHGSHKKDTNNDERDGEDECICPVDYNETGFITDDTLRNIVKNIHPEATLVASFDSCHSGSVLDLPYLFDGKKESIESTPLPRNIKMLSGCKDAQTSADAQFAGADDKLVYSGALTYAIVTVLADIRVKGATFKTKVKWSDFLNLVRIQLKLRAFTQLPQFSYCVSGQYNEIVCI